MRAAKAILVQLRLCVYFIIPPFFELGSIRSIPINVAVFESPHGKQRFRGLIGKTEKIYQTEHGGEPAFMITVGESIDKFCANFEQKHMAKRLNALESEINELKSTIFRGASYTESQSKKGARESGFGPGPEPRLLRDGGFQFQAVENNISVAELKSSPQQETLATLEFKYTRKELNSFLSSRTAWLTHKITVLTRRQFIQGSMIRTCRK